MLDPSVKKIYPGDAMDEKMGEVDEKRRWGTGPMLGWN